jgi:hypothetical protein
VSVWRTGEDEDGTRHYWTGGWTGGSMMMSPHRFSLTAAQRRRGNRLSAAVLSVLFLAGCVGSWVGHHVWHTGTATFFGVLGGLMAPSFVLMIVFPFFALAMGVHGARAVARDQQEHP